MKKKTNYTAGATLTHLNQKDSTPVKSCQGSLLNNHLCLIVEEALKLLRGQDDPVEDSRACSNTNCEHNFFYKKIFENGSGEPAASYRPRETAFSRGYRNCMCLLDGEGADQREIAEMWGCGRTTILNIEHRALEKIRREKRRDNDMRKKRGLYVDEEEEC